MGENWWNWYMCVRLDGLTSEIVMLVLVMIGC